MIWFEHNDQYVSVKIKTKLAVDKPLEAYTDIKSEVGANAVQRVLVEEFRDAIDRVYQEAYEQGWKDKAAKRKKRRNFRWLGLAVLRRA